MVRACVSQPDSLPFQVRSPSRGRASERRSAKSSGSNQIVQRDNLGSPALPLLPISAQDAASQISRSKGDRGSDKKLRQARPTSAILLGRGRAPLPCKSLQTFAESTHLISAPLLFCICTSRHTSSELAPSALFRPRLAALPNPAPSPDPISSHQIR